MQIALPCCFKIEFGAQAKIQLPRKTRQLPLMGKLSNNVLNLDAINQTDVIGDKFLQPLSLTVYINESSSSSLAKATGWPTEKAYSNNPKRITRMKKTGYRYKNTPTQLNPVSVYTKFWIVLYSSITTILAGWIHFYL